MIKITTIISSSPELENMLLLFVVNGDLADGVLQADGDLVVVRDALSRALIVFVEAHLVVIDDTVHVMPGSEETHTELRHSDKHNTVCLSLSRSIWTSLSF